MRNNLYVEFKDPINGFYQVSCNEGTFNEYIRRYPDGNIAAKGQVFVESGDSGLPVPDEGKVMYASYFNPSGDIVSRVVEGVGVQTFFFPSGEVAWTANIRGGEIQEYKRYAKDGKVISSGLN